MQIKFVNNLDLPSLWFMFETERNKYIVIFNSNSLRDGRKNMYRVYKVINKKARVIHQPSNLNLLGLMESNRKDMKIYLGNFLTQNGFEK